MQYKIIVDKQPSSNPSSEKKEYVIDIEELRVKSNIYDSINIEQDKTYVTRRLSLSEYGVLSVLETPVIEELPDLNIELFEGDNYIYLMDMQGNGFYAEYLIKNDFNDMYATKNEMNSAITQTAQSIELSVNQKLTGYSTTQEMNSAIQLSAQNINLSVNEKLEDYSTTEQINSAINLSAQSITSSVNQTLTNYATSDELEDEVTELNSTITQTANEITSSVFKSYATKTELNTAKSEIKQTTDSITSTVSTKVGKNEVISSINQSAEAVTINANKISLAGKAINLTSDNVSISSTNFSVDKNGNMSCNNATMNDVVLNEAIVNGNRIELKPTNNTYADLRIYRPNNNSDYATLSWYRLNFNYGSTQVIVSNDGTNAFIRVNDSSNTSTILPNLIQTPRVNQTSLKYIKKNISKFTKNATNIISSSEIYEYNLKSDKDTDKKMIGFVIGGNYKTPAEIISIDGKAVELYSAIGILWKGFQEQEEKINKLMEVVR